MSDRHANNYQEIVQIESEPESNLHWLGSCSKSESGWVGVAGSGAQTRLGAGWFNSLAHNVFVGF